MKNVFHKLNIGDKFHDGKSNGSGIRSNEIYWMEYEKTSKSKAKCVKQVNYGNTRLEGGIFHFAPYSAVWRITE